MAAKETLSPSARRIEEFMERKAVATAPAWRPNPGDIFIGTVVGRRMGEDKGWGEYPIVVYKNADGDGYTSVHAFHTMLREILADLGSEDGQTHMLSYDGERIKNDSKEKEEKDQETYHFYYGEDFNNPEGNGK